TPFGRTIERSDQAGGFLETVFNILWAILFGWEIAVAHLTSAIVLAITI
ncbi:MAG: hypothetical protein GWN61_17400, partial [candidate division Zixibacteria bacterium]|nr:hypothetical protein [candidate division Zixibacteria bacterium]NIS47650.1 hypothetical protein [candidate division Zixibacteria bacterium]NIU15746.1 hypothetical protein [candidate division Zixibacteria bacterium]NIV07898.1 hypothetical protein [candidate division Zixibacteria bacterium]NIW47190.1 hypothetical protein [Gammaproteobacteria bacterium]